jgi:DnaJ-class molecular chaperone
VDAGNEKFREEYIVPEDPTGNRPMPFTDGPLEPDDPPRMIECRECNGTGKTTISEFSRTEHTCPRCDGAGEVESDYEPEPDMDEFI